MSTTLHTSAPEVQSLVRTAFPGYSGKRFTVETFSGPMVLNSYWSGGSRDYWALVNMATGKVFTVPENGTPWTNPRGFKVGRLPLNLALVRHSKGHYESTCVYVSPENISKYLPAPAELSREEKIVLAATSGLKSSYAGIKDYRFHEANQMTGIPRSLWDSTKAELIGKGLLNKAGAITDAGRNAIGRTDLYQIGKEAAVCH